MERLMVAPVEEMDDETVMLHLENRHDEDLKIPFVAEPDRAERRLNNRSTWEAYHKAMHRLYPRKYEHEHREP